MAQILVMQAIHRGVQFGDAAVIADHVVGTAQARRAIDLGGEDLGNLRIVEAIAGGDPGALKWLGYIDYQYPVDQRSLAGLEQQRDDEHDVRRRGIFGASQHRVEDRPRSRHQHGHSHVPERYQPPGFDPEATPAAPSRSDYPRHTHFDHGR